MLSHQLAPAEIPFDEFLRATSVVARRPEIFAAYVTANSYLLVDAASGHMVQQLLAAYRSQHHLHGKHWRFSPTAYRK